VTFANGRRRVLAGRRWVRDRDGVGGRAALRSKSLGALVVLSVVFGGVTAIEPARAETPEERALAEARAKLTEVRAEIEDAERVAEDASDALEDADATLREIEQVVNETTEAVERQRKVTQHAHDRLEALEDERDELIRAFNQRAVRAFKLGPTSALDVLFGGDGASDAIDRTGYSWPLCAPVTSEYGPRWGRMHRGIDLGAPTGTPIGAAKAGTVISAGWQGGYGRLLLIDHGDGVVTAYAHLSSFAVSSGQSVQRGQTVGRIGMTGNTTGPHLHLEFRVNGRAVNPRQYLSGRPPADRAYRAAGRARTLLA
jgi:murein DD-endopeptidase MepM/ murein hydrolase activator NlpD